ncbi:MAG: hypothetical protein JXA46_18335 [Dehalococcoidales bacterium]|nr:hypothetical protein [Dehalococcoidales bacterium]
MKKQHSVEIYFNDLEAADRIVVTTNLNRTVATISDAGIIAAILDYLKRHSGGWTVPDKGVPVTNLRLNFYRGERILGNIGAEQTLLVAHQYGGFYSRTVDEGERPRLLEIAGLESQEQS